MNSIREQYLSKDNFGKYDLLYRGSEDSYKYLGIEENNIHFPHLNKFFNSFFKLNSKEFNYDAQLALDWIENNIPFIYEICEPDSASIDLIITSLIISKRTIVNDKENILYCNYLEFCKILFEKILKYKNNKSIKDFILSVIEIDRQDLKVFIDIYKKYYEKDYIKLKIELI